jgi:hypothetical protein
VRIVVRMVLRSEVMPTNFAALHFYAPSVLRLFVAPMLSEHIPSYMESGVAAAVARRLTDLLVAASTSNGGLFPCFSILPAVNISARTAPL